MKLQNICDKLHFNALKEPGTIIQCIERSNLGLFKIGNLFRAKSFRAIGDIGTVLIKADLNNQEIELLPLGLSKFKKFCE